jgi:hypothetical protein
MLKNLDSVMRLYRCFIIPIFIVFLIHSVYFIVEIYSKNSLTDKYFCYDLSCFFYFISTFKGYQKIIEFYLSFIVSIVTVLSLIVATCHYVSTNKSSNAMLHLESISTFSSYLEKIFHSYKILNFNNVDSLKWYNEIFPKSFEGDRIISDDYIDKIDAINKIINDSNQFSSDSPYARFNHQEHQKNMIRALKDIGINMSSAPRGQFFESEELVLGLVSRVNKEFCGNKIGLKISKREYC